MTRAIVPLPQSVRALIADIRAPDAAHESDVQNHLDRLTKPPGSLGELERIALRLACIYGDPPPALERRTVFVLAADHGVAKRGVSAYPSEVTAQMCRNLGRGTAAVNVIARRTGASVVVADVGVDADDASFDGVLPLRVRRGTRDLYDGPALDALEAEQAILAGAALVDTVDPPDLVGLGEMGIGNTTSASVITAALTGAPADIVTGAGTGVDGAALERKRDIVAHALARLRGASDPFTVLTEVGGLEIAALAGVVLGAARARRAVVTDGFIATTAALLAVRMCDAAHPFLFASHLSSEPGHRVLLEALGLRPLFSLDMRLGEGTGAALAFPLLDAAASLLREMATFESAQVSGPRIEGNAGGGPRWS